MDHYSVKDDYRHLPYSTARVSVSLSVPLQAF